MTTSDGADRRTGIRVNFNTEVNLLINAEGHQLMTSGDIKDISLKGIFVKTAADIKEGTACDVRIELSGTDIPIVLEMKGKVVRMENNGAAIHFDAMDLDTFMHLKNVVLYNSPE